MKYLNTETEVKKSQLEGLTAIPTIINEIA